MTTSPAVPRKDPHDLPDVSGLSIAVLGGTGEQGRGLATRWAQAGLSVAIGSRDADRAAATAGEVAEAVRAVSGREPLLSGGDNASVAGAADVVIVAVPWAGHADVLRELAGQLSGRIVVDCVNPLGFDKQGSFALPVEEGSAAQQAASILVDSQVVAAFHHVSAVLLQDLTVTSVDTDVLVLGDDRSATDTVQALAGIIPGMRGLYGGRLRNAHQVEALTANLISANRRYRTHAGVRLTGV